MKKTIILLAAFIGLFIWGWQRWCVEEQPLEGGIPLVVGTNVGYPPFIMRDEFGAITGFDHDIATVIAEHLGRPILFKDMSFDALLLSLEQGSVDMIIGGISITKTRKDKGWPIPYYGSNVDRLSLVYRTGHVPAGLTLEDAQKRGLSVCTQAGTSLEEVVTSYEGLCVKTLADISDIYLEVDYKNSDIAALDLDTARTMLAKSDRLSSHEVLLAPSQRIEGFGIGVAMGNDRLREQVIHTVLQLQQNNVIAEYAAHWFGQGS